MQKLQTVIGTTLLIGVLVSTAIVLFGGVLYLIHHGNEVIQYKNYLGEPVAYKTIAGIWMAAFNFSGKGIIQLGVLLLVLVQFLRVLLTIGVFAKLRDFRFVAISIFIFAVLIFSFVVKV